MGGGNRSIFHRVWEWVSLETGRTDQESQMLLTWASEAKPG